jgi:hypothetical protein
MGRAGYYLVFEKYEYMLKKVLDLLENHEFSLGGSLTTEEKLLVRDECKNPIYADCG